MTVSEELPCPFCGEQPHFTPRQGKFAAYVACINESCGIQPESGSMDPAYAKARWNTRAMKAAEPLPQGDGGLVLAIMCVLSRHYEGPLSDDRIVAEEIAALVRSKLPIGDDVREALDKLAARYSDQAKFADVDYAVIFRDFAREIRAITAIGSQSIEGERG